MAAKGHLTPDSWVLVTVWVLRAGILNMQVHASTYNTTEALSKAVQFV